MGNGQTPLFFKIRLKMESELKFHIVVFYFDQGLFEKNGLRGSYRMHITFLELIILALASFRLTRLFVFDKITAFIRNFFIDEIERERMKKEKGNLFIPKRAL